MAHEWAKWLRHPCRLGDPHRFRAGEKSEVAQLWAKWLCHPYRLGDPHRCRAGGGGMRSGPQVGKVATSPLPSQGIATAAERGRNQKWPTYGHKWLRHPAVSGSPPLAERGKNQKWQTCGQSGYVTPAVSGIPTCFRAGEKSEVAHLWAKWLRHPCRLGGSPPLQSGGGGNQKWPTCAQRGYVTPAVSGIPTASERGGKSEVAHIVGKVAMSPLPSRGSPPLQSGGGGGGMRSGPLVGKVATSPLPSQGSPPLQSGGAEIRSGPLMGKVATSPLPSRGSPPLQSGGKIRSGPLVGKVATSPLPSRGSPTASERGKNQKWPTCGQSGYVTPAVSGIPTAAERGGGESEVAHKWAKWLRHPCRLGDPHRCRAGGEVATLPTCGPLLISVPALQRWGSPRRQG